MAPITPNRFPTHLALTGDVLFGPSICTNNILDIVGHILNGKMPLPVKVSMWGRQPVQMGAYLATQCPVATGPLRLAVNDEMCARQVPEEFDGSIPSNPSLMPVQAFLSGVGVLRETDGNKKSGVICGKVQLSKHQGWVDYTLHASFEDSPRFKHWNLPAPRQLVAFDAILDHVGEDDTVHCSLRRITVVDPSPTGLLGAFNVGNEVANDRAALILGYRNQQGAPSSSLQDGKSPTKKINEGPRPSIPTTTPLRLDDDTPAPPGAPKAARGPIDSVTEAPPSPSPAPTQRGKRARQD